MKHLSKAGLLIAKIHHLTGRITGHLHEDYMLDDFNPAQGHILFALLQEDNITVQELAKQTALSKSTITAMLDRLENQGLIRRNRSTRDRRMVYITLEIDEEGLLKIYNRLIEDLHRIFFQGFSIEEIREFDSYLERILENLTFYEQRKAC